MIVGEQGGISKSVNWQGGGECVYAELLELNAFYKSKISNANESELNDLISEISQNAFLDYRVSQIKNDEFDALSLDEKKKSLNLVLDSNMDYVGFSEIDDVRYAVSDEIKELNEVFYGKAKR